MKLGILDFFQDIANFFKGGTVLGVDIGTASIKIVELTKKGENLKLVNYGVLETKKYLERSNKAIQTSSLKIAENEASELLSLLLREMKTKTNLAIASMPAFYTFSTMLELPILSAEETKRVIMFQAQQYMPVSVDQLSIEWYKIGESESRHGQRYQKILLIGIPNDIINKYKQIFKKVGLKMLSIEVEGIALVRALEKFFTDVPTIVVDIGAQSTSIVVVEGGVTKGVSQTDYSGIYLTQALSRSLGISIFRAEELKRRRGLEAAGVDSELSTLLLPFLDVIIQEVVRVKSIWERTHGKKIEKLMLSGGGANLLGIEKYLVKQMGLSIAHQSLLLGIEYPDNIEPTMKKLNNELAVAFGLAKRYFI